MYFTYMHNSDLKKIQQYNTTTDIKTIDMMIWHSFEYIPNILYQNFEYRQTAKGRTLISYVEGFSEKKNTFFFLNNIPGNVRPGYTLRQKLVHPKEKTLRHKLDNVVYAVQRSED